jgi:flagellar hook-associated protein 2
MSSPITFSGFNNIDFNVVLNALMAQASQPLTALQTRQSALESQSTEFDKLNSRLATLHSAADALSGVSSATTLAARTSDPAAVGVSVSSGASAGDYDVVVNELARAQVTASTSTTADATTTVVASGGTLTIGGVDVTISSGVTLQQLAQAINSTSGIGVTAAVIRTAPGSYRLALTSNLTGTANAFTITNGLSGGAGVTFGDADANGVSGDSLADNAVNSSDASILVNNIAITNSSNTFDDVVPGVTLTALKKDPAATVHIGVSTDSSLITTKVNDFISAYNDIVSFLNDQRASAAKGDATSIGREPLLRQLKSRLRTELLAAHGSGIWTRLSEIGVEFTTTGTLSLDESRLGDAVASDAAGVRQLFAGTGGVFPAVGDLLDTYSSSSGLISTMKTRLAAQVASMNSQIASMQARLALQRETLQREFAAADAAMAQLRSQSDSLAGLASQFKAF